MGQYRIFQSCFWQLNSVVYHENKTVLCWDPAYSAAEIERIRAAMDPSGIVDHYLLYTHGDYDHIAGDSAFTGPLRVGSFGMAERRDKAEALGLIEAVDHEYYVRRDFPPRFPKLDIKVEDKGPSTQRLSDVEVHFFPAPGHTADGLFTLIPSMGLWIAGDYLSDIEFPFVTDLGAYAQTLETASRILEDFPIEVMVPGHGNVALRRAEILDRIERSKAYLGSLEGSERIKPWQESWGTSPFYSFLDKMHEKNIQQVRSQNL
ncbi:MAG TPA: MBL fold metallo-hydrolase [Saprospiraceae bacterium]|nr:MBL fold metallo-hydrolase [Saprospiraceae bacterium]